RHGIARHAEILPFRRVSVSVIVHAIRGSGRTPKAPDRSVVADDVARTRALVEAVHILCDEREAGPLAPAGDRPVRGVWLASRDHLAPPRVPFPDERGILREGFGRRQLLCLTVSP